MSTTSRLPDFFVAGAPKCGTTALSEYLREHPRVFMCQPKEPFYYAADLPSLQYVKTLATYRELFANAPPDALACGEATAMYLFSDVALEAIRDQTPDARIVIMLRNPVDLVHAFHGQLLYAGTETERSFERAWALQAERQAGKHLPDGCREPRLLQYREVARLGAQVTRLLETFPRDQVQLILFDDFAADPGGVYRAALEFLGVADDGRVEFPPVNQARVPRVEWLARLSRRPPPFVSTAVRKLKHRVGWTGKGLLDPLRQANSRNERRAPLEPRVRRELAQEFREDRETLARLIDRNLDHWATDAGAPPS